MRELLKSIGSFSWALSLFGARQAGRLARPSVPVPRQAGEIDAVTSAAAQQLDGRLRRSFEAGDRWQRSVVDLAYGVATFEVRDPKKLNQLTADVFQQSTAVVKNLLS